MRAVLVVAGLFVVSTASLIGQRGAGGSQSNPFLGNTQAISEGESLYNQRCTTCHGFGGGGDTGPALVSGDRMDIGVADAQTFNIIKNGVPGTPMAPQRLADSDIWRVVTYIHALRGTAIDNPLPGDVAHGEAVFWGKGQCGNCHLLSGRGGLTGPDLANIAGIRKASSIVDALTKEQHRVYGSGGAHLQSLPAMDSYLPVHITTADGKTVDGVLLNEDGYSLQMIGNDQQLYLFDKSTLRRVVVEPKSLMPTDYDKRLTPDEFKDLMAFLTRQGTAARPAPLRGGPPEGDQRAAGGPAAQNAPPQITWTFDRLDTIGGLPVTVYGNPKVIETPLGKAIEFDGVDDSIYIDRHPLAGAEQFTFEAIFRPNGGAAEQRWFHLAERSPATGQLVTLTGGSTQDASARFLFELRVIDGNQWCLDAFVAGPGYSQALLFRDKLHPIGQWYHVASTYDGHMFRSYVNGALEGEVELAFTPHGPGGTSVGTRMNHVNYFNGAVRQARFTPRALTPDQFLKTPGTK